MIVFAPHIHSRSQRVVTIQHEWIRKGKWFDFLVAIYGLSS
jgi:hypothetical protein